MDENIRKYLSEKYKDQLPQPELSAVDKYNQDFSDEKFKETQAEAAEKQSGLGWAQFAGGIGDALAGRDSSKTAANFEGIRKGIKDDTVGAFEKRKTNAINDIKAKKSLETGDANSERSMAFRKIIESKFPDVAKAYGDNWGNVTADDQETIFKPLQLREQIEARNQQAKILAGDRVENRNMRQAELDQKREEKLAEKSKPSEKQVEAFTDLDNAESDLKNMLSSLGKNSGWTGTVDGRVPDALVGSDQVAFRSAVGKYKDAYRKAITGAGAGPGEIAILEKRLPSETDRYEDFIAKANEGQKEIGRRRGVLAKNLEKAGKNVSSFRGVEEGERQPIKRQVNKKTGEVRVVYSDGTVETAPSVAGGM